MSDQRQKAIDKLRDLIHDIDTAMLTTIDGGVLRSRPMSTQQVEYDGDLWFMTNQNNHQVDEIMKDNRVNISYASPEDDTYVSVSGRVIFSNDRDKIAKLWKTEHTAWFPEGQDDPNILLMKIMVEQAEYWDTTSNTFMKITGFLKAMATGEASDGGENKKIDF
jgi:general stress protein 26